MNLDCEIKIECDLNCDEKIDDLNCDRKIDNLNLKMNEYFGCDIKTKNNFAEKFDQEYDKRKKIKLKANSNNTFNQQQLIELNLDKQQSMESNLDRQQSMESNLDQQQSMVSNSNQQQLIESDLNQEQSIELNLDQQRLIESNSNSNQQKSIESNLNKKKSLNEIIENLNKKALSKLNQSSVLDQKNENNKFLNLSDELINKILDYLNLSELIELKLINKRIKSICETKLENKDCLLLLTNSSIAKFSNNWFHTNEKQKRDNLIKINLKIDLQLLETKFKTESIFKNLKKLFINLNVYEDNFNINAINQLKELEQLDISFKFKLNSALNLPKLRILNVNGYNHCNLILKTPMLSFMKCKYLLEKYYHFTYPKKLIYLFIENSFSAECIMKLKNLEYLFANNYSEMGSDQLIELNKLKELHLCIKETIPFNFFIIDKFRSIYMEKLRLNLVNLNLFISGVNYEKIKHLTNLEIKDLNQNDLILNNLSDSVDVLPFVEEIDYTKLYEQFKKFKNYHSTLNNLINKFPNIKSVIADKISVQNVSTFFKFISYYNLTHLTLTNSFNNQKYYDQLPQFSKTIIFLCLNTNDSIDYGFVTDYKYLNKFETSRQLDANAIDHLFNNMDSLIKIDFINGINYVDVEYDRNRKRTKYYYRLFKTKEYLNAKLKGWTANLDEIFKYFGEKIIEPQKIPFKITE